MNPVIFLVIYLTVINIITFIVYAVDKSAAKNGRWRVREFTLIALAFIGGSVGALIAMYTLHHKTKKPKFFITVPLFLILQAVALFFLLK